MLSAPGVFFAEYARKIEENAGKIGGFPRKAFQDAAVELYKAQNNARNKY